MKHTTLEKSSAYLCPRIVSVESRHVYYGGDQSWLPRNTAYKGGCGPVCGANLLTTYADRNPQFQNNLNIHIDEKHFIQQDEYLGMLQEIYSTMRLREVPIINYIYDNLSRTNRIFKRIPTNFGASLCHFTRGVLRYGLQKGINLQYRSRSTIFCSYTQGLTFIKLALANGYPVVLLTTNCKFPYQLHDRPYIQDGTIHHMHRHFVTITDIRESLTGHGPELVITTWGKTGTINYRDLYCSWQSIRSFGSGLVYFIPAKNSSTSKRALIRAFTIPIKR